MKYIAQILLIVGFCLGTIGAAGFHSREGSSTGVLLELKAQEADREVKYGSVETFAIPFFASGLILLLLGGHLAKRAKLEDTQGGTSSLQERSDLQRRIGVVRDRIGNLSTQSRDLSTPQVKQVLDELEVGDMYDLTSQYEHWTKVLGSADYSMIWAGVASGERLTNRAWTLFTDGFPAEGRGELALAYQAFDEAYNLCH